MKIQETEILLREMFAIDGRILDADRIKAWHNVIGNMPLEIAQRALRLARQDERIGYVEPKHIIGKAKESADALDRQERVKFAQSEKPVSKGFPQPTCIHGELLLSCSRCCHQMHLEHERHAAKELNSELCLKYAKENIYA
jgi:hypothetical protein